MRSQLEYKRKLLPLLLLTALVITIAASRVMLEYHTVAEVFVGIIAGYIALLLARFFVLRGHTLMPFDAYALALWGVVAVFIAHGYHLPAEDIIRSFASHMRGHVPFCAKEN